MGSAHSDNNKALYRDMDLGARNKSYDCMDDFPPAEESMSRHEDKLEHSFIPDAWPSVRLSTQEPVKLFNPMNFKEEDQVEEEHVQLFNPMNFKEEDQVEEEHVSTLENELAEIKKQLNHFKSENASLRSKVRILNEVIFEEQEKTFEEETKRKSEEEKSRNLQAKLDMVESELLAVKSQAQSVSPVSPLSEPSPVSDLESSSDCQEQLTVYYIPETNSKTEPADLLEEAQTSITSIMGDKESDLFVDPEMGSVAGTGFLEMSMSESSTHYDSGIDLDFKVADNADKINIEVNNLEVGQVNNNMGRDGVNETLFGLEEENMELKHQLHSTYQELSCVRSDLFQLDSKFQDAESERIRLVKRVTDLFRSNQAQKMEFLKARDLIKNLKEVVIELQDNTFEMEDNYREALQQLNENRDNMKKRGRQLANAFKDRQMKNDETGIEDPVGTDILQECFP
ncbi:hypothetical protein ACHWQZ_G000337 [Mnemiopsis leidyi]